MTTIKTHTAKIHVLQIGTKQLTLTMARQLDTFPINKEHITNFHTLGRIHTGTKVLDRNWNKEYPPDIELIGTHTPTGMLMILRCLSYHIKNNLERQYAMEQMDKPLIILGGMK